MERRSHLRQGFTLMEIMIAVAIIGIILAVGVPAYNTYRRKAMKTATITTLKNVKGAIESYRADTGKLPSKLEELVDKPSGAKGWEGPYLEKIPADGWKQELDYKVTKGGKHSFELSSQGGYEGDATEEDQISVWNL